MKRFALLALAFSLATSGAVFAQGMKVGTVDMDRIFKEHPRTKEAELKFNQNREAAKKEYDDKAEAYKKALDDINKIRVQLDAPTLSADAKAAKAKERDEKIAGVRTMERGMDEFKQTREQEFQQEVAKVREEILKEITEILMAKVKADNYDYVFEKTGPSMNGFSPILYSRENIEFTNDVIDTMKKTVRAPAKTASSPAASPGKAGASPAKAVSSPAASPKKP